MKKGMFITLEGNEGAGKSTQIRLLADYLKKQGYCVYVTRDPGGTAIGDQIRQVLLDNKNKKLSGVSETFLYMASRAQLVHEEILPRLKKGQIVLCDRWIDATVAYQGFGAGVDRRWIGALGESASQGIRPALSLFLDLPLEIGLRRAKKRRRADRMESKDLSFHRRVREGFLWIARTDGKRFKRIGLSESDGIEAVFLKVTEEVSHVLR